MEAAKSENKGSIVEQEAYTFQRKEPRKNWTVLLDGRGFGGALENNFH